MASCDFIWQWLQSQVQYFTIGGERTKQPLALDRLGKPEQARHGAFLLDQDHRVDRIVGIVHGDHEVERGAAG